MKQVGAPGKLALAQHLARAGAPGVGVALEADQAAQQEHRQADIRVPEEGDLEESVVHGRAPRDWAGAWVATRRRSVIRSTGQLSLAFGPKVTSWSIQAAS